jgi:hypothetical protein
MLDLLIKRRLSTKWRFLVGAIFALLFIGFTANVLVYRLSLNLAHVILNKTLWQSGKSAVKCQQMLSLLQVSVGRQTFEIEYERPYAMISAITVAEYHRRQNDLSEAVTWLRRAADA